MGSIEKRDYFIPIQASPTPPLSRASLYHTAKTKAILLAERLAALFIRFIALIQEYALSFKSSLSLWMRDTVSSYALPSMARFTRTEMHYIRDGVDVAITGLREQQIIGKRASLASGEAILSGICFASPEEKPPELQKWIIFFLPNLATWEGCLIHLANIHKGTGANLICYNYPKVAHSTGDVTSQDDLLIAGRNIVNSIIQDAHVPAQNVLLHGFSIGGIIASMVAADFADKGIELNLCNERSTLSVPHMMHAQSYIGYLFSWIFVAYNWTLNAHEALLRLKGRTKALFISNPNDPMMLPEAQAVRAIEEMTLPRTQIYSLEMESTQSNDDNEEEVNEHARPWSEHERTLYNSYVKNILQIA